MFRLALRNLWAYKRRLLTSGFAVVLGISFLCGSFIFTDTLKGLFSDLFSSSVKGVDAVVRSEQAFELGQSGGPYSDGRALLPISVVDDVAKVDGVEAAAPAFQGYAQLINKKGKLVKTGGAPTFGNLWIDDAELNPYRIREGRPPQADNEVVLDVGLTKTTGYKIGDKVKVNTAGPVQEFTVVGDATFGTSDSALGATSVFFTPKRGTELMGEAGALQAVLVRGKAGANEADLVSRISSATAGLKNANGTKLEVISGADYNEEVQGFVDTVFSFISYFFTAFAVIALFVSTFVIANSFSIVVAQRNREMAMLRCIGASRRQVVAATFIEALCVGLIASAVGIVAGIGVAWLIRFGLGQATGGGFPASGFKILPRTIVVGMIVGTIVTVFSSVFPAVKASRIKPLAALRENTLDKSGQSKVRLILGSLVLAASIAMLFVGLGGEGGTGARNIGFSAGLFLVSTVFLGPILARPIAGTLGRSWFGYVIVVFGVFVALSSLGVVAAAVSSKNFGLLALVPLVVLIGVYLAKAGWSSRTVSGRIARENSVRNPTRTSATALALTIGTAVVCGILVLSTSLTSTFRGALEDSVKADYIVASGSDFGFPREVESSLRGTKGITAIGDFRFTSVQFLLRSRTLGIVNPNDLGNLIDLGRVEGDITALKNADTIAVNEKSMADNKLKLGDTLRPNFANGQTATLKIVATYENEAGFANPTYYIVGTATGDKYEPSEVSNLLYVRTDGNDGKAFRTAAEKALEPFPSATLQTKKEFADARVGAFQQFLTIVNALLALAIIIAVLGIANTLRLSIFERTREIGLLRAIGQGRDQTRMMIRWEAIVVATFGTILGLAIGTGFGSALVKVLGKDGTVKLTVPVPLILGLALLASVVGLYAARKPAKDAAKLNILQAIATE